jgi:ABC-type transport system substrate-binding protein
MHLEGVVLKLYSRVSLIASIAISIWSDFAFSSNASGKLNSDYRLILSETDYPASYDPLDADLTNNADLMKLRYITPIEIDQDDKFRSTLLKSFEYNNKTFTIVWKVNAGLFYSDGSPIIPADILIAIKRMALKRNEFPVLSSVKGIKAWSLQKDALQSDIPGLKLKGDTITIEFDQNVANPLFQFSLSLFAVQPSKCFDLKTSKLICDVPPASGYYDFSSAAPKFSSKEVKPSPIGFVIRKGFEKVGKFKMPPRITLEYSGKNLSDLVKTMDDNSVARVPDSRLTDEFINQFRKEVDIKRLPKTAIIYLLLNPNFDAFKDKTCRRIFANTFRKIYGDSLKNVKIAAKSFSSPIMPGYLTNEQIEKLVPTPDAAACTDSFKKHPIKYMNTFPFWDKLILATMEAVGMPTTGVYKESAAVPEFYSTFIADKTAVISSYVSFWPLDLASGFNMFFSPEMHSQLKFLLADGKLTDLSKRLFKETDPALASDYYEKINLMLYEDAQLNALSYFGDAYVSKATNVNRLPIATSEPNPWHLFSVK